jgi:23S rRNA (cytidine1920-2'-O)/16S rRNA (cytidine1409-2'-O)-methyltransferase
LQRGAQKVFAVDVGYNQLVYSLRQDERVVCMERINVRTWDPEILGEKVSVITVDVSFISLMLILESALGAASPGCRLVALVKPQFEVGREEVGKGGIVRNEAAREAALVRIQDEVLRLGATKVETMDSPILGTKGNHEFLLTCVFGESPI